MDTLLAFAISGGVYFVFGLLLVVGLLAWGGFSTTKLA